MNPVSHVPGVSAVATSINNAGVIVGFPTDSAGNTSSWMLDNGQLITYQFPGGSNTQAFGVSGKNRVVGSYQDSSGATHGFVLYQPRNAPLWQTIDDPNATGNTVANGINNAGDLIGFYTDAAGNTHGMLAVPSATAVRHLTLSPMPQATATLGQDAQGHLAVQVSAFGLTPGSAHTVQLLAPGGSSVLAGFGSLTAGGTGQADATLDSSYAGSIPSGNVLVLLNATQGGSVAAEPIAKAPRSAAPAAHRSRSPRRRSSAGHQLRDPSGTATISYNAAAQTLKVTVTASGLAPGTHAAHIHIGSCARQGPVRYMLMDFTANGAGQIMNETRVLSGVTTPVPAGGWYLNLHQGNSNTIVQNGQPAIFFRPLLCSDI
jgi:hypothetical protein